jgi:hypothetical protein
VVRAKARLMQALVTELEPVVTVVEAYRQAVEDFFAAMPAAYLIYYHRARTHLSLDKDAPEPRLVERLEQGRTVETPMVGGLHHRYGRLKAPVCGLSRLR